MTPTCWWSTTMHGCARCLQRYLAEQGFRVTAAGDAAGARATLGGFIPTWWCSTS